jgi:hypothetical protein
MLQFHKTQIISKLLRLQALELIFYNMNVSPWKITQDNSKST